MTYRDRRAARAARLRDWADKRIADANAALVADDALPYAHDIAFLTQPGHIPARAAMNARADRAYASLDKADRMAARADSIDRAAANAIYSDDPDAIDRLTAKIADLTADRDRMKAANADYRKAHRADLAALTPYARSQVVPFPDYALTNLTGNISRLRARLNGLQHPRPTWFHASRRDPDVCYKCDARLADHAPHPAAATILVCPSVQTVH